MKARIFGLLILMLLIGYVGWESASTHPDSRARSLGGLEIQRTPLLDSRLADGLEHPSTVGARDPGVMMESIAGLASPDVSPDGLLGGAVSKAEALTSATGVNPSGAAIYVFHSKAVVATNMPTEQEMARLRQAVEMATQGLPQPLVVLDADALSLSQTPFVLYAKAPCDLTEMIQHRYAGLADPSRAIEMR